VPGGVDERDAIVRHRKFELNSSNRASAKRGTGFTTSSGGRDPGYN